MLRQTLRQQRVTGRELAARLGVKPPMVSRWMSAEYHGHSVASLRRIADALDLELDVRLVPRRTR